MSEQATAVESAASAEQQAEAERIGWIPATRYKGDPARFIDAEEFIRRGNEVLPIVKKQLETTRTELAALRTVSAEQARAIEASRKAIADMEERHTVATQRAVDEARKDLKASLARASEAGDHEAVAELTEQMTQLSTAERAEPPPKKDDPPAYVPSPEQITWQVENSWYGVDKKKTSLFLGIAQELREGGDTSIGRAFYDKVKAETEAILNKGAPPPVDKVEGGRNGSEHDAGARSGGKKTFASLPREAKEACEAESRERVGPGKRYKTADEWRAQYASLYFAQE